jgi:hypothetical protein
MRHASAFRLLRLAYECVTYEMRQLLFRMGVMTPLMAPSPLAGSDIYERILTAPGGLVVLEHDNSVALVEQFRAIARNNGQSVYVWDAENGMENLREAHARIPGSQRLGNALRYIQQSIHFGVYLLTQFPLPMSAMDSALLRQLARAPAGHVRRVVLLDVAPTLVASFDDVAVRMSSSAPQAQHPRLRDGRWLL